MTLAQDTLAQRNRELVLGALESATSGDVDGFLAAMDPNVQVHEPPYLPYGGLYEGPEGFLELFAAAGAVLSLAGVELISATADDERTVLLMTAPLASTGEKVHITEHWCVRDGKVVDVRVFWFELPDFE